MSDRCEPAEKMREKRGPHLVRAPSGDLLPSHWSPHIAKGWWGWPIHARAEDAAQQGWRYEGPVAPPDLVRELVRALDGVAAGLAVDGVDLRVTNVVALHKAVSAAPELLRRAKEAGV